MYSIHSKVNLLSKCNLLSSEPGEVAISFNGGKDSTVIFHLIRLANVKRKYPIPVCYAATPDPFPQLESFIKDYSLRYANEY